MMNSKKIFEKGGPLSGLFEGYEFRPGQLEVASAVERAISEESVLIAEAGPGVGKSFAYLAPFSAWAFETGKRVLVSTHTKALQSQLVVKDLPVIKKALGIDLRFSLCLGSENYVCLRKLDKAFPPGLFDKRDLDDGYADILEWVGITDTGLITDMDFSPEPGVWEKVKREYDMCEGKKCKRFGDCFYMAARRQQASSHVLVCNNALLFTSFKKNADIFPEYSALVMDEAHTVEDAATSHLGVDLSSYSVMKFLNELKGMAADIPKYEKIDQTAYINGKDELFSDIDKLEDIAGNFFSNYAGSLAGEGGRSLLFSPEPGFSETICPVLEKIKEALEAIAEGAANDETVSFLSAFAERARILSDNVRFLFDERPEDHVFWVKIRDPERGKGVFFKGSPVRVASILRHHIFESIPIVVLASATLSSHTAGGDFFFLKERLGIDKCSEVSVESPFQYREKVLLYLPEDIPDPVYKKDAFTLSVAEKISEIYDIMGGRTFSLFTSYDMLRKVSDAISFKRPDINMLKQGDLPRYVMLDVFKKDDTVMLMGTSTFWQGVDVPGSSLECVIITKLPFAVPTDPVHSARMKEIELSGRNPFNEYQIPQALIMFKQGFGRLIRSHSDRGVFTVLDPRIRTRRYGKKFLDIIPLGRSVSETSQVRAFFADET